MADVVDKWHKKTRLAGQAQCLFVVYACPCDSGCLWCMPARRLVTVLTETGSKTQSKIFKALDQDVMQQVSRLLADPVRTRARTRLARTPVAVLGQQLPNPALAAAAAETPSEDPELFDDGDFYQELLRELST